MMSLLRRLVWWLRGRRKEAQLQEELQFHLDQEAIERQAAGLPESEARWAAQRDLGNEAKLREDVRSIWTWRPFDELSQDLRYAFRTLFRNRAVTIFAVLSLALGIGANTAIYSFMDAILMRSLPVPDAASLVVMTWRSKPFNFRSDKDFVLHSIDGSVFPRAAGGMEARIFPYQAFAQLQRESSSALSSVFATFAAGRMNVLVRGEAEFTEGHYVSGDFFRGVAVAPLAGRVLLPDDDKSGAEAVVVVSDGYAERRFGTASNAVGQLVQINNVPFTVVGVTPAEFFGVDPGAAPNLFLPMHTMPLFDPEDAEMFTDQNYYWTGIMGRLRPGTTMAQAESALAPVFAQWVAPTATNDAERANLPVLQLQPGAGGLDSLRRRYSRPLYLLLAMVGVILAIACANTANLLLARATARRREIAVRLSIGAGRFRLIRQLLTESILLASLGGALGIAIAVAGTRLLAVLLANGNDGVALQPELNLNVLGVTIGLSLLCGVLFGLAPAWQSTRPALVPALKDADVTTSRRERYPWLPQLRLQQVLVVSQIALLMLLLVGAGLFVRTLSKLQTIPLGFNPDNVLLFDLNAAQAGYSDDTAPAFYADLRTRLAAIPGVRSISLSHSSLLEAGRGHPVSLDGVKLDGHRILQTGPGFFATMQIPVLHGREFDDRDRAGAMRTAVISDLFATMFFPNQDPIGRHLKIGGGMPMEVEIVGVTATARYGSIKRANPPVLYVSYAQLPPKQLQQMTYAIRTEGDPMQLIGTVRQIVHDTDARVPITSARTQAAEIARMINQEIVMARLASSFAIVALVIACVGLYGTIAYGVMRRTREIGIRMALGARRPAVIWMVLREACVLTVLGLAVSIPLTRVSLKFVASFLFDLKPDDPQAMVLALATLLAAALVASYVPARRASRIDPTTALRHE